MSTAVAAGIGSGSGFFSSSVTAERSWFSVKAEYTGVGDSFRRFVMQPNSSEVEGKNIMLTLRPMPSFSVGGSYQNIYQPLIEAKTVVHGSVSNIFASGNVLGARLGGSFYHSQVAGQSSQGITVSGSYRLSSHVETTVGYFSSHSEHGAWQGSTTASIRETITSRFKLLQTLTRSAGQTNLMFGGDLILKRAIIGVDHQTIYLPFAGGGFKQVLSVNLRLRPFGQLELAGNTVVSPEGKLQYTASAGDYLYLTGSGSSGDRGAAMAFSGHVVRGCVTDESGNPIAGAALHVDDVIAYTDSEGTFLVRMKKARTYSFKVALDEFVTPSSYEVVSAPKEVKAESENTAHEVKVVLRQITKASRPTHNPQISQNVPPASPAQ
ncbi:MAG TPA: carboxypeptidase-like regulatory domain-containing protein [Terriglobales bacterium]|nr:carboxypeptidase-like regulatory domain-containing protein [Terriglobales bacterium]